MRSLALVAILSSTAVADTRPLAVATDPPRHHDHPHAGVGGDGAVGMVRAGGADDGWLVRGEFVGLPALTPRGRVGPLFGLVSGAEAWFGPDDWGMGLPFAMALGVRAPGVRAMGLLGWQTLIVDHVADDTGVGFFAPMAGAQIVAELRGWHLGLDARVVRRWQFGADDRTQWQGTITVGYTLEQPQRGPVR